MASHDSMGVSLSRLGTMVKAREAWHTIVLRVTRVGHDLGMKNNTKMCLRMFIINVFSVIIKTGNNPNVCKLMNG